MPIIVDATIEHMTAVFSRLKQNFRGGKTLTIVHRVNTLKALKAQLISREVEINEASRKDLGMNNFFSYITGAMNAIMEIDLALKKIYEWTSPVAKETPIMLLPSTIYEVNEPLGVVLVIGAWNYPITTLLLPVISAIAAGNCVVAKPSENAPHSSKVIFDIINSLDQNCYLAIEGGVPVSVALNKMPFDLIVFTGGTVTGKFVMKDASDNLSRVVLELGGKNPVIIDASSNFELAAKRIVNMKFMNCGQTCVTADLVYVHSSVRETFLNMLLKHTRQIFGNNARDNKDYGLIINEYHANRLNRYLDEQKDTIVFQAGFVDTKNRFVPPTILLNPSPTSLIMKEEVFGPILPLVEFNTLDELIDQVNSLDRPLGVYYFGDADSKTYEALKTRTSSGSLVLNDLGMNYLSFTTGFGGVGMSGVGKIRGYEGFKASSNQKCVIERPKGSFLDLPFRYCPTSEANLRKFKFIGDNFGSYTVQDFTRKVKTLLALLLVWIVVWSLFKYEILILNVGGKKTL